MNRFKPRRAGIIGLWDYEAQEFFFADGRLVLRGANGSGKTKALEVLFPFVLDGRMDPHRLDPFSGEERSMKKNLLFHGEKAGYGYAWMEFAHGQERVTVGVGMQAREEGSVRSWFFVTDLQMPDAFSLLDAEQRPLSRQGLTEVLGADAVFERAVDYRAAIDARLFGLGVERYEAMLDLVLTLRRPQLAKALKLESLSRTLSEGLRPLDDQLIRDAAQAFEDLEKVQRDLDKLARADHTLDELTTAYRTYLGSHAASRAEVWTAREGLAANARYEVEVRALELEGARATRLAAEALVRTLGDTRAASEARQKVLLNSEAYRELGRIASLRDRAASEASARRRFDDRVKDDRKVHARAAAASKSAQDEHRGIAERLQREISGTRALAEQAGVTLGLDTEMANWAAEPRARLTEVEEVFRQLKVWEAAKKEEQREEVEVEDAARKARDAEVVMEQRATAADEARGRLATEIGAWAPGVAGDDDRQALLARLAAEEDERTLQQIARERFAGRLTALGRAEQSAEQDEVLHRSRVTALDAQIARIGAESDDAPVPFPFRPASRTDRPGAPLWRLVRFADHLGHDEQVGLEGALEAAGLLDAWLEPEESAGEPYTQDAFLVARPPVDGPSLADWLVPEPAAGVPEAKIAAWLRSVSASMVRRDGGFDLGPVRGAWTPTAPRYIGATARAQHRARRIAELGEERGRASEDLAAAAARREDLRAQAAALEAALVSVPRLLVWNKACKASAEAAHAWRLLRDAWVGRQERLGKAQRDTGQRYQALRSAAQQHGTPAERVALERLRGALESLLAGIDRVRRGATEIVAAARRAEEAVDRARDAKGALDQGERQLAEATASAESAAAELVAAESLSGQGAQDVLRELKSVDDQLAALDLETRAAGKAHERAVEVSGGAEAAELASREKAKLAQVEFERSTERLAVFANADLAGILGVAAGPADFAARLVAAVGGWSGSEAQRKSSRTRVDRLLQTLDNDLGVDYHPAWNTDDDVLTIEVEDGAGKRPIGEFGRVIKRQLEEQRALLTAREQALFEDQLLGSLADQLRERIAAARTLVKHMDAVMHGRRMSSGHSVGVSWARDPEAAGADADVLNLLERAAVHLGDADRAKLRRHFAELVKGARSVGLEKPYQQILATALDYRRWFRFDLTVVEPDGRKGRLTAQRYAQLSGGEKSASLHMPLFAAAHAHFNSARKTCPRLVALDEAFAGIDDTGRPELVALTVAFDLDLFMTGFDLWVTDPAVPAVAHYDLFHDRDNHAVSAWLIVWNGRETVEGEGAEATLWL